MTLLDFPKRSSYFKLIIGAILLNVQLLDFQVGLVPIGLFFRLAGALLAIWGGFDLMPRHGEKGIWIRKLFVILILTQFALMALIKITDLMGAQKPDLPWPESLSVILVWGDKVFFSLSILTLLWGFKIHAKNRNNSTTEYAWRQLLIASLICYLFGFAADGAAGILSQLLSRNSPDLAPFVHDLIFVFLGFVSILGHALPPLSILRGLAAKAALDSAVAGTPRSLPCRFMLHSGGLVVLLALFLIPFWIMMAMFVFVNTTPDFNTYSKTHTSDFSFPPLPEVFEVESSIKEPQLLEGVSILDPEEKKDAPPHIQLAYYGDIDLFHGEEELLNFDFVLAASCDLETKKLNGLKIKPLLERHDPRFRFFFRVAIPFENYVQWESEDRFDFTLPFHVDAALVSGPGPSQFEIIRVKGLETNGLKELRPKQYELLDAPDPILAVYQPGAAPIHGLFDPFFSSRDAAPDGSLQYLFAFNGWISFKGNKAITHFSRSQKIDLWNKIYGKNYSFSLVLKDKSVTGKPGSQTTGARTVRQEYAIKWLDGTW